MKNFINTFKRLVGMTILLVTFFIFMFLLFFRLDIMTDLLTSKVGIGITVAVVGVGVGFLVGYLKCYLENSRAYEELVIKYNYCKQDLREANKMQKYYRDELTQQLAYNSATQKNSIMDVLKDVDFSDDTIEEEEVTDLQEEASDDEA